MAKYSFLLLLSVLSMILISCNKELSHDDSLKKVIQKLQEAESIAYDYNSKWDNRFNKTVFRDSAHLMISRLENSDTCYGVHVLSRGDEYIFSGSSYLEILHEEKKILNYDVIDVVEGYNDISSSSFMMNIPLDIVESDSLYYVGDTLIDNFRLAQFRYTSSNVSVVDSSAIMTYHTDHYIDIDASVYNRVELTSIKGKDTLQVITTKFEKLRHNDAKYGFDVIDRISNLDYKLTTKKDEDESKNFKIEVGDQIAQRNFQNAEGQIVDIINSNRTSVVMFSFIGCGGCERALLEFNKKAFDFIPSVDFYYSSPVDRSEVLKTYLENKNYDLDSFGKESNMNDYFGIYSYPTFIVLNDNGVVERIEWDYDVIIDLYMKVN